MKFEPNKVEQILELMEVEVNLTEVFVPTIFNEAKRHEKDLPKQIVMRSRASDAKYSGMEVLNMVNVMDEEIGRLITMKKNILDTFQDSIEAYEEKKQLENLDSE